MQKHIAISCLIILLSSCVGSSNESLALDVLKKITGTFDTEVTLTLKDTEPLDENPPPPPTNDEKQLLIADDHSSNHNYGDLNGGTMGDDGEVYYTPEEMPEFPGGDQKMKEYLRDHIHYPEMAREQGIQGKVWLRFVVDESGNISKVEIVKGIGGGCDEEAKRVIQNMPAWTPGMMKGKPVKVAFTLPVNFVLR
jgi:protein TonB